MTDEQLRLAWELYDRASDLPASERVAYVRRFTSDPLVTSEVLALLAESVPPAETTESQHSSRIGSTFGPYRITSLLGRGGMGEVYAARDTTLDRTVALKLLPADRDNDALAVERQIREARAASSLNHPNIVSIFQVVESNAGIAIAMELVEGNSFRKLCSHPSPVEHVCRFGVQVAQALAAAHQQGIIHRDVKPENLMVRPDGYVKVLDFGLAREVSGDSWRTAAAIPIGTLRYMSPEQIRGAPLSGATDVFSLGLVLFEMATGRHAFDEKSPLETAHAIISVEPPAPSSLNSFVPEAFDALIGRMLNKDPESRPTAGEVADGLMHVGQRISSQAPDVPARIAARPLKPSRARLYWLITAVAAAAGALVLALRFYPAPSDATLEAIRFNSDPDVQGEAAISSDGGRVAYLARGSRGYNVIFVQSINGGAPVRLTAGTSREERPAWSPDDRSIAFLRNRLDRYADLVVVEAEGGGDRQVARLRTPNLGDVAWSSDGKSLIVATNEKAEQVMALYAVSLVGGPWKRITNPPAASEPFGDSTPALSPDGRNLAFSRSLAPGSREVYIVPVNERLEASGAERKIETGKPYNTEPAWTPDSREIVFSSGTAREGRLMRMPLKRGAKPRILLGAGEFGESPAFARRPASGNANMIYTRRLHLADIYRLPFDRDVQGVPRPRLAAERKLVTSRSNNIHPGVSPDGGRVAFVSDRTGSPQIWVLDIASGMETQWTNSNCTELAVPNWSNDGRRITYTSLCDNQTDVFVVDGPGREPLRLTDSPSLDEISRFSPDDKWIYFTSYRDGQRIWRVSALGGQPQPVTNQVSSKAEFSWDGKTLYFSGRFENKECVWSMPVTGGDPKLEIPSAVHFVVARQGIFFSTPIMYPTESRNPVRFNYRDYRSGQTYALPDVQNFDYVFAVPPDGSALIYSRTEQLATDLMTISQFR